MSRRIAIGAGTAIAARLAKTTVFDTGIVGREAIARVVAVTGAAFCIVAAGAVIFDAL